MIDVRRQRAKYILSDYVTLNLAWLVFTLIRYRALPAAFISHYTFLDHITSLPVVGGQIIIPIIMLGLYWISGYYNQVFFKSRIDEAVNTAAVSTIGSILVFLAVLINDNIPERFQNYEMIAILWILLFSFVYTMRLIITTRSTRRIRNREIAFNTLVIGTGKSAQRLVEKLENSTRGNGFNIVGYVETNPTQIPRTDVDRMVIPLADIEKAIEEHNVSRLVVVPHHNGMRHTSRLLNSLLLLQCRTYVTPDLYNLIITRPRIDDVAVEPLVDITTSTTSEFTKNCKRVSDVVVSALTLVLLAPVYLCLAIAIKLDSPGPVFYRQERIGYRKQPFYILKFRSMRVDAESSGPSLSSLDDPRITRLGHYLRKYRLDELPQFWNVLRGDMSIVGPRPEREFYIRQIVPRAPYYTLLHQVRPGITSWGMVKYGYATTVDQMIDRLRYDLIYLENVSFIVDLKILFHTINTVLTGKGL